MILVKTDRLIIRPWEKSDIEPYSKIVADPRVMQHIGAGKTLNYTDAEKYIHNCIKNYEEHGWSRFAVELKENNELIGFCGFSIYNNELDFGWRYAHSYWNKGYGTEAAKAVLHIGINGFKFPRIVCIVYPENLMSIRIIEKLGMTFEKEFNLKGKRVKQYVISTVDKSN